MRPNFFVIGAQKAGTTALCSLLAAHPEVGFATTKEPHYFSFPERWARGEHWYLDLFRDAVGKSAVGEGSTTYSMVGVHPEPPARIARFAPDARIIYLVRHPLERLESSWLQRRADRQTTRDFGSALRDDPRYLDATLYHRQLTAYRRYFPHDHIRVLFLDDLRDRPDALLRDCFALLGVDPAVAIDPAVAERNTWRGKHEDGPALAALRRLPLARRLFRGLPGDLRRRLRQPFERPIRRRPEWTPELRAWVLARLGDDPARLLADCGRPLDLWDLEHHRLAPTGEAHG